VGAAASRVDSLQLELTKLREALEGERAAHAATAARLDGARLQSKDLHADLLQARLAAEEMRARADTAGSAADERAHGAERRVALEIERERVLRVKAEKSTESMTRRFEDTLKAQIAASEQLTSVEISLAQLKADARQQEQSLHSIVGERDAHIEVLKARLSEAQRELAGRTAQEVLMNELVAKLVPPVHTSLVASPPKARGKRTKREGFVSR